MTRRPRLVALLRSAVGLAVMAGGFARYLSTATQANVERFELYAVVFIGALTFATSAIRFCKLRGTLDLRAAARPGHGIVNVSALLLCGWLGYGFVTEQAQPFGLAALLAMSALAVALGTHLTLNREYSNDRGFHTRHTHAFAGHCQGFMPERHGLLARIEWHDDEEQAWVLREIVQGTVRAAAYRHRRGWHNRGGGMGAQKGAQKGGSVRQRATHRATYRQR